MLVNIRQTDIELLENIRENEFKIKSVSRPFKFIYKHFIFKSEKVQTVLKNIEEQKQLAEQAKRKQTNES